MNHVSTTRSFREKMRKKKHDVTFDAPKINFKLRLHVTRCLYKKVKITTVYIGARMPEMYDGSNNISMYLQM